LLAGVSCASASTCTAVGSYSKSQNTSVTLAERWNGKRWSIQRTPNPAGQQGGSQFTRLACTAGSKCIAIGSSGQQQGDFLRTLAERWNGKGWRVVRTPSGMPPSGLNGVACASATNCVAVGNSGPANLAEGWNGGRWKVQNVRNVAGGLGSELGGVACHSAAFCIAVGDRTNLFDNPVAPLAERWNGTRWRIQRTPRPGGRAGSALTAVVCPFSVCLAVGFLSDRVGNPKRVFGERWNGSSWSIVPVPNPSGAASSFLGAVACARETVCVAVGTTTNSAGRGRTLAERWNGVRWSIMPTPNAVGAPGAYLSSVSCPAPSLCVAAGSRTDSTGTPTGTLVELWNGSDWTIVPTPIPAGAKGAELDGISCGVSVCLAAGAIDNPSGQLPLAERWDYNHWTILPTPKPPGAKGGFLNGVGCWSEGTCTIVGLAFTPTHPYVYADRWNGATLTYQATPPLPGAFDIDPPAVACPTATSCMTVGAFKNTFPNGPRLGLAERWKG
jgi:hypothetical protein